MAGEEERSSHAFTKSIKTKQLRQVFEIGPIRLFSMVITFALIRM